MASQTILIKMKKKLVSCLLMAFCMLLSDLHAQTFEEYLTLFEPIKQDYGFAGNALKEASEKKKPIPVAFRAFIEAKVDTLAEYYPMCVFGDNTYYIVLLVCKNKKQPELLSLVSRLYDSKGNRKPTRLDIDKEDGFLAYIGENKENHYSFFTEYNAKHYRFSIWYKKASQIQDSDMYEPRTQYRAYTLSAEGYTRYSPTADLAYDPYSNTTPYAPPANAVKIDYEKNKSVQLQVGQIAYFPAPVHGSVGIGANIQSTEEQILQYVDGHNTYERVQIIGMTGGDRATYTFIFQALKAGKCHVVYKKNFRGKIEKTYKIKVSVTN